MRALRAILLGILLWILIFVEISIVMIGLEITGITQSIAHYILLIPLAWFCASLYYKSEDKMNGFVLGVFFILVSTLLDLLVTVPFFIEEGYAAFYSDPYLWIGLIEAVFIVGIYDILRPKGAEIMVSAPRVSPLKAVPKKDTKKVKKKAKKKVKKKTKKKRKK